jgi:hypothetical protein
MRTSRLLCLVPMIAGAAAACGGSTPPTMEGRDGMLSRTAVAQKCEEAAEGHEKPFLVEWDATDLASFEARSKQATVFVEYTGCKLEVLYECKDETNATAFGTYGVPQPTSGNRQGFDIENEGDLYANLPLGAAKLGGKVSAGEKLHLEYFISAVATASRDSVYRGELKAHPGCAEATHYVWAYNLGAFELASSSSQSAEVDGSVAGFGAGGSRKNKESSLGKGGDLESCLTNDQRSCRVPIRLALRRIKDGDHPGGASPTAGPPPGGAPPSAHAATHQAMAEQGKAMQNAVGLYTEANGKFHEDHDGKQCLARLDRAMQIDSRVTDMPGSGYMRLRALCTMAVGQCDEGKNMLRTMLEGQDTKRIGTDVEFETKVRNEANQLCPSSTAKTDEEKLTRLSREVSKQAAAGDAKGAKVHFATIEKMVPQLQEQSKKFDRSTEAGREDSQFAHRSVQAGKGALRAIVLAVAKAEGCPVALPLYQRAYRLDLPGQKPETVDKVAAEAWKTQIDQKSVVCK